MTTIRIGADATNDVSPRLLGSFVEHMGRAVYDGIHAPDHPSADADGFRGDVLGLVRELGPRVIRYPGGNFVSGYRWEDGVGPVADRPRRLDLAWRSVEPNAVGTNEFLHWCRLAGTEPMLAVNLGTRGIAEACDLLEYVNHPGGTALSDLRRAHGVSEPWGVRLWCLGNELDGPWQLGQKSASEYGRLAAQTAKAMRLVDPDIELVAVGSSGASMPTFGSWEREVLAECYPYIDHLSLHSYYEDPDGSDPLSLLASADSMASMIETVTSIADAEGARQGSTKKIGLSFDEWNVWHMTEHAHRPVEPWQVGPAIAEDDYSALEGVVIGTLLITLLQHSARVRIGCLAQLVNVIAPIRTNADRAWRQTTFGPFADVSSALGDELLPIEVDAATHRTAVHGDVADVTAAATRDAATGRIALFVANRTLDRTQRVRLTTVGRHRLASAWVRVPTGSFGATGEDALVRRPLRLDEDPAGLAFDLPACNWAVVLLDPGQLGGLSSSLSA